MLVGPWQTLISLEPRTHTGTQNVLGARLPKVTYIHILCKVCLTVTKCNCQMIEKGGEERRGGQMRGEERREEKDEGTKKEKMMD